MFKGKKLEKKQNVVYVDCYLARESSSRKKLASLQAEVKGVENPEIQGCEVLEKPSSLASSLQTVRHAYEQKKAQGDGDLASE